MKLETAQRIIEECHPDEVDCEACPLDAKPIGKSRTYCSMLSALMSEPEPAHPRGVT